MLLLNDARCVLRVHSAVRAHKGTRAIPENLSMERTEQGRSSIRSACLVEDREKYCSTSAGVSSQRKPVGDFRKEAGSELPWGCCGYSGPWSWLKEGERHPGSAGWQCLKYFPHTCPTQTMSGTFKYSVISNLMKPNQPGVLEADLIPLQLLDLEKI